MTNEEKHVLAVVRRWRAAKTILAKMKWTIELRRAVDRMKEADKKPRGKKR